MALCFIILCTPRAKTIATIAGSPSGIAATANEIAVNNISNQFLPWSIDKIKMITHIPMAAKPRILPSCAKRF